MLRLRNHTNKIIRVVNSKTGAVGKVGPGASIPYEGHEAYAGILTPEGSRIQPVAPPNRRATTSLNVMDLGDLQRQMPGIRSRPAPPPKEVPEVIDAAALVPPPPPPPPPPAPPPPPPQPVAEQGEEHPVAFVYPRDWPKKVAEQKEFIRTYPHAGWLRELRHLLKTEKPGSQLLKVLDERIAQLSEGR